MILAAYMTCCCYCWWTSLIELLVLIICGWVTFHNEVLDNIEQDCAIAFVAFLDFDQLYVDDQLSLIDYEWSKCDSTYDRRLILINFR